MREIKFRAWDRETCDWYYSDKEYDDYFFEFKKGVLTCFGIIENPGTIHDPPHPEAYECENVEQFTGLKDHKRTKEFPEGQKIYEGDVVRLTNGKIGEIRYSHRGNGLGREEGGGDAGYSVWRDGWGSSLNWVWTDIVIGNIHENPELLK